MPLTSQDKRGEWYARFEFKGRTEVAALHQIRMFSVKRLYEKIGEADDFDVALVQEGLLKLLWHKNGPSAVKLRGGRDNPEKL